MDLKQIEYFVRVAELGSFTRAAVVLNIAQPALSRQVRLLEVELRQNLLVRNGRGAVPTEAGKALLEHGRGILHQVERAREELGRVRGALAGRVAIGLPHQRGARVMTVPADPRLPQTELPEVRLSISEGLSGAILGGLDQRPPGPGGALTTPNPRARPMWRTCWTRPGARCGPARQACWKTRRPAPSRWQP